MVTGETHREAAARADAAEVRAVRSDARADQSDARADAAEERAEASDDRAANLLLALDHRDVIGMAKGILMHAETIGPEAAFAILVRTSQREQRKLHEVALDLVAGYPD